MKSSLDKTSSSRGSALYVVGVRNLPGRPIRPDHVAEITPSDEGRKWQKRLMARLTKAKISESSRTWSSPASHIMSCRHIRSAAAFTIITGNLRQSRRHRANFRAT